MFFVHNNLYQKLGFGSVKFVKGYFLVHCTVFTTCSLLNSGIILSEALLIKVPLGHLEFPGRFGSEG